ncbi:hypothetical protein LTV02_05790 [Nocardia yamanashiensis]|nr:hypothetical protein [Nocardia yamanashiensis]UGT42911.1 hypothetical protein LTV02_05790 [Nocardia yamanashiensis]
MKLFDRRRFKFAEPLLDCSEGSGCVDLREHALHRVVLEPPIHRRHHEIHVARFPRLRTEPGGQQHTAAQYQVIGPFRGGDGGEHQVDRLAVRQTRVVHRGHAIIVANNPHPLPPRIFRDRMGR